jgi:hypothetical protein
MDRSRILCPRFQRLVVIGKKQPMQVANVYGYRLSRQTAKYERLEYFRDPAGGWFGVCRVEQLLRAKPALPTLRFFIEDRVIRKDYAGFGMHCRAPSSTDEIMKVPDQDSVLKPPRPNRGHLLGLRTQGNFPPARAIGAGGKID